MSALSNRFRAHASVCSKNGLVRVTLTCFHFLLGDHGSFVIYRSASVRPKHLFDQNFDHDYYFNLPLARERDAHSFGRCSRSRHVRFRAFPRADRTLPTSYIPNHFATSSTAEPRVFGPWPPWRCSFADAAPGAYTVASSPNHNAPLLGLPLLARNAAKSCLAW